MRLTSVAWILAALMCGAAVATVGGERPTLPAVDLVKVLPDKFGVWSEVKEAGLVGNHQVPGQDLIGKIYHEMLTRTYVNRDGDRIMLSMAWGSGQRAEPQVPTRPLIVYPALNCSKVENLSDGTLATSFGDISVRRFTMSGACSEAVTYWLTMAGHVVRNDFDKWMVQVRLVPTGQVPDGLLFRVSSIDRDAAHAFGPAVPRDVRQRLSGLKPAGAI